ncbi:MAG: hypothetical protein WC723_02635 [Candidatus Omnitrophota bacterium]
MNKRKTRSLKCFLVLSFSFLLFALYFAPTCFAQQSDELEFILDAASNTIPLPRIFKPGIDLSGRGFHRDTAWPQTMASKEALDNWQKDIGFGGMYRLQYSLWEISQLDKDKDSQKKLLDNYESIIKNITNAGGVVILDIFGTPANLGKVLDKKSPPKDLKAFKELVKRTIRYLSCDKRYNIWYEVWSAPDIDDFFLGRKQEYLHLYRAVAEGVNELKSETKIHIPIGGPSVSWWFQNLDGNTIITPERSLIYELIKFCYHYNLPLDFISWHGYSTDPGVEKGSTIYNKAVATLIRDWLTYFSFDRNTPLIVDEWNFDRDANVLAARGEQSFICASYIPSRIKGMQEAGINYQLYFSLEDFQNNKEGVVRNTGIFSFDPGYSAYKGGPKPIYNVFKMLSRLGNSLFMSKLNDEFIGVIATKDSDRVVMIVFNYIDPDIVANFLTRNIADLNASEAKALLNVINSRQLEKILLHQLDVSTLRATNKVKTLLTKARELNDTAKKFESSARNINIKIKNLKGDYLYQRYVIDSSCGFNCEFAPAQQKELSAADIQQEVLSLKPYSVHMIVLEKKPAVPENTNPPAGTGPAADTATAQASSSGAADNTKK